MSYDYLWLKHYEKKDKSQNVQVKNFIYIYIKRDVYKWYKSHSPKCSFTNAQNVHVEHVKVAIKSPKLLSYWADQPQE